MPKYLRMLVLLVAMLILAACSAVDDGVRGASTLADNAGQLARSAGDEVLRSQQAIGDDAAKLARQKEILRSAQAVSDDAARLARQKEIADILAANADTLFLREQQAAGLLTEQRRLEIQAGLEEAVCAYLNPSEPQEFVQQLIAQVAADVSVSEPVLLGRVIAVSTALRQAVSDQGELVNAVKLYCEAKGLR